MPGAFRFAGASPDESGEALGELGLASADVGRQRVRLLLEQLWRSADIDSGTGAFEQHHRRAPTTAAPLPLTSTISSRLRNLPCP